MTREEIEKAAYDFCDGEPHRTTHLTQVMIQQVNAALEEAAKESEGGGWIGRYPWAGMTGTEIAKEIRALKIKGKTNAE